MKLQLDNITSVLLFGGGRILVSTAKLLKNQGYSVFVYTAPRQLADKLTGAEETLKDLLEDEKIPYQVSEDINNESALTDHITPTTLGLGFGEAWSFDKAIINRFAGRLLDYMGIPLPKYRGGAHYTWALMTNEKQWGCHFQVVNEYMIQGEFDSGELVFSHTYQLSEQVRTPDNFFDFAIAEETKFIARFIDRLKNKQAFGLSVPDESSSYLFPRLHTLKNGWINWQWQFEQIADFICAFDTPYPGASTYLNSKLRVLLRGCRKVEQTTQFHPYQSGLITRVYGGEAFIIAGQGLIALASISDGTQELMETIRPGDRLFTSQVTLEQAILYRPEYTSQGDESSPQEISLNTERLQLRPVTLDDCNQSYLNWLEDKRINQYLETRWSQQSINSIQAFVKSMSEDENSHLLAIVHKKSNQHIGNIKLGPINRIHKHADISYFIGEPSFWGQGLATEAIQRVTDYGLNELGLESIHAGVYSGNTGSSKALEKAGYQFQGKFNNQLTGPKGREDHIWYGIWKECANRGES